MQLNKYNQTISLICPTCGNDQFEYDQNVVNGIKGAKCACCGRVINKDDLILENSENINQITKETGKQVSNDFSQEMRASLKRAFKK